MRATRGTTNTNVRGSATDRRRRKLWLLSAFGDGTTAACSYCGKPLTVETITVDRVVPGCRGGTYARGNIQPACALCNSVYGGALRTLQPVAQAVVGLVVAAVLPAACWLGAWWCSVS